MGLKKDKHELTISPPVAGMIPLEDPLGNALPCPVDFAGTTFDLTSQGGLATESFADGDALATRWTTLTGFIYTYNATSCELETADATAPAYPPIIGTPPVVGLIELEDPNGDPLACPVDFANTTFDMTAYGGGATDSFANSAALAAFVDAFDAANDWFYNSTTCVLESYTVGAPTGPAIPAVPPVTSMVPLEDPFGNPAPCPVDFGSTEPVFGRDVAFYVFRLPFLNFVVSWFFAAFIIIGIITAIWHYINGGIRIQTVDRRSTPQVKAHLSIILAFLALFKAADYYLQRFDLLTSQQGFARGAFYTDLNASLPAIQLLLLISLFSVGLLVANIWRRGWALPSIAVGLWALIAVIAGGIYPAVIHPLPYQRVGNRPQTRSDLEHVIVGRQPG